MKGVGVTQAIDCQRETGFITTASGVRFYPLEPRAADVRMRDVAHALSLKVRWTGHVDGMWTVGLHCLATADAVAAQLVAGGERARSATVWRGRLWALLHDAHEAYLPDVARPLKPHLSGWAAIERGVDVAIFAALGVTDPGPEIMATVKQIDALALHLERLALFDVTVTAIPMPDAVDPAAHAAYQRWLGRRAELCAEWRSVRWSYQAAVETCLRELGYPAPP